MAKRISRLKPGLLYTAKVLLEDGEPEVEIVREFGVEYLIRAHYELGMSRPELQERFDSLKIIHAIGRLQELSVADIVSAEIPETVWTVDNLFPCASPSLLAADSGVGKTWIMLTIAKHVALGQPALGWFEVKQRGPVVYFWLDDTIQTLQDRLDILGIEEEMDIHFVTKDRQEVRQFGNGGEEDIAGVIDRVEPAFVVVDVLEEVRPMVTTRKKDQYREERQEVEPIRKFCAEYPETAFVFTHHTNKYGAQASGKPMHAIMGGMGLIGAFHNRMVIDEEKQERKYLYTRGKDIEDAKYRLEFNLEEGIRVTQRMDRETGPRVQPTGKTRAAVLAFLTEPREWREIFPHTRKLGLNDSTVKTQITRLREKGDIVKDEDGRYRVPVVH